MEQVNSSPLINGSHHQISFESTIEDSRSISALRLTIRPFYDLEILVCWCRIVGCGGKAHWTEGNDSWGSWSLSSTATRICGWRWGWICNPEKKADENKKMCQTGSLVLWMFLQLIAVQGHSGYLMRLSLVMSSVTLRSPTYLLFSRCSSSFESCHILACFVSAM